MAQETQLGYQQYTSVPPTSTNTSIAVKENGFTLLSTNTSPDADVFFIHGLAGHPRNSWTYPEPTRREDPYQGPRRRTGLGSKLRAAFGSEQKLPSSNTSRRSVFWPLDLLTKDFPNVRIFTFGYDSHPTNWFKGPTMQLDIFSYGESLLNGLEARRRENPDRPLIFIVHSLGGLVLKEALRRSRSSSEQRLRAIHLSTKAIIFFGTPHRGVSYMNLVLTVQKMLVCSGFDANDKLIRDVRVDSSTAKLLGEEFSKILDEVRPKVYTFQEATGMSGFGPFSGKVVEDSSSALDYSLQEKDFIYANHVNMCRFTGFDDDGYEKTKAALAHCLSIDFSAGIQSSSNALYQRILASLYLPDSQERFDQVEDACDGTFEWLFEKPELGFVKWLRSGKGIFWISGKPASGKSTLLKYAVSNSKTYEDLRQNNPKNRWVCGNFFFTNRGKQTQKSIDGLLQRILYQLLSQVPPLVGLIERIFKQHAGIQGEWILIYLEDALMTIVRQRKHPMNICLFIDALDEHDENYHENHSRLVQLLQHVIDASDGKTVKVMLCLTSRPENVFQDVFRGYPGFRIHEHTQGDIQTYLSTRMNKYLGERPDICADGQMMASLSQTFSEVTRRAQGVFLWVKLVVTDIIEGLRDGDSPYKLHQNLSAIPGNGDLQELYSGILLRLRANYLSEAFLMLQIAYSATEPTPFVDFFQVLQVTLIGPATYDWATPTEQEMKRKLLSRCRGFLEIQQSFDRDELGAEYQTPVVQFLHQSVKDFLRDSKSFEDIRSQLRPTWKEAPDWLLENGHAFLLRYRVFQHLRRYGPRPYEIKARPRFDLRKFDVLYHAYMVELTLEKTLTKPLDVLSDFADANGLAPFYLRHEEWVVPPSWQPSFITLAVQAGLLIYVQYTAERRYNIHQLAGRPLLHWAVLPMPESLCRRGTDPFLRSPKMVKLLIQLGARIDARFEGLTAFGFLFMEFIRGNTSQDQIRMLESLLKLGSSTEEPVRWEAYDENAQGQYVQVPVTALQQAVQMDNTKLAKVLLQFNAKLDALTEENWKFLRKGYIYSDETPDFQDTAEASKEQQEQKWLNDKERAIREGRNTKPMLRLIQDHQQRLARWKHQETSPYSYHSYSPQDLGQSPYYGGPG
ncbi:MAG: hypothetical protein M1825_003208 [Sarcosagium campestre]|nr:MAG: hypothetical protein M1825_003208 [Sarcosagium campestre]